jgi:hypothetical protein
LGALIISNCQQRFWAEFVELSIHIEYLECFYVEAVRLDTSIEVLLAVVSNGSIAGWVIWSKAQFVWAAIIAFSHLVTAIRPHLPYQKRVRSIEALNAELRDLLLDTEEKWYGVSEGLLTDTEIHDLTLEIKRRKQRAVNLYLSPLPLPYNRKYFSKAEKYATQQIKQSYLGG